MQCEYQVEVNINYDYKARSKLVVRANFVSVPTFKSVIICWKMLPSIEESRSAAAAVSMAATVGGRGHVERRLD